MADCPDQLDGLVNEALEKVNNLLADAHVRLAAFSAELLVKVALH